MSDSPKTDDELAGTEQPFVAHLMELRDRLVKAVIAVAGNTADQSQDPGPGGQVHLQEVDGAAPSQ